MESPDDAIHAHNAMIGQFMSKEAFPKEGKMVVEWL